MHRRVHPAPWEPPRVTGAGPCNPRLRGAEIEIDIERTAVAVARACQAIEVEREELGAEATRRARDETGGEAALRRTVNVPERCNN